MSSIDLNFRNIHLKNVAPTGQTSSSLVQYLQSSQQTSHQARTRVDASLKTYAYFGYLISLIQGFNDGAERFEDEHSEESSPLDYINNSAFSRTYNLNADNDFINYINANKDKDGRINNILKQLKFKQ